MELLQVYFRYTFNIAFKDQYYSKIIQSSTILILKHIFKLNVKKCALCTSSTKFHYNFMSVCQGWGEGMRRGLRCAGEWALLSKNKTKQNKEPTKTTPRGKTVWQAGQGKAGTGYNWGRYGDELAQDCKHKDIINGANEEGNEIKHRWGKSTNNQETRYVRAHGTQKTKTKAMGAHQTNTQAHASKTNHQPCAKQDTDTQLMRILISSVFTQDTTTWKHTANEKH